MYPESHVPDSTLEFGGSGQRSLVGYMGRLVGLDGLEPSTSVLSGPRSNRLSYRPPWCVE